jgi:capsid protein
MNLIDRAIRAFAPESAVRRERARAQLATIDKRGFRRESAISSTNRKTTDHVLNHPDSSTNHYDRVSQIKDARDLEENNAIVASCLRKYEVFVVGRTTYIPRTQSESANAAVRAYVERWMLSADLTGRHTFRAMIGLAAKSMIRDGDLGFNVVELPVTPQMSAEKTSPIRLQAIEADRIGSALMFETAKAFKPLKKNEQDFSGVVVDGYGKPVRYRIFNRQKANSTMQAWREIDAANFLHVFDPIRFDGYRGYSAIGSAINDIKDLREILACEKQAVKYLCSISGVVEGGDGTVNDDVLLDDSHAAYNADASTLKAVSPGSIESLPQGHKFNALEFTRPSPTFAGFAEMLVRLLALAFKLPYGIVYSWANQGTASRFEAALAAREFEQVQLVIEERLLNPIIKRVIARGIQLGHLPAVPDFDAGEWRFPAKITADVGRESKADIEEIKIGLRSKTQVNADRGEDRQLVRNFTLSEKLEVIEDAKKLMAQSGGEIDLKTAIWMLESVAPTPPVEAPEEPAADEAADDSTETEKPAANEAPPTQQSFHINANLTPGEKRRSVTFIRDKDGKLAGAEIQEEN